MGLFDALFGGSSSATTGQQRPNTSIKAMEAYYHIAKFVLPERLFRDENHVFTGGRTFIKSFQESPVEVITELMVYVNMFSNGTCAVPRNEAVWFVNNFRPLCGDLNNNLKYLVIEYPRPLPMQIVNGTPVVGPFFSAFVYSETESSIRYYILRTTSSGLLDIGVAREFFPDGTNFNLGNVSSKREDFLKFLTRVELYAKPITGGVDKDGNILKMPLFEIVYRYYPDAHKPNTMILNDSDGNLIIPAHWRPVFER